MSIREACVDDRELLLKGCSCPVPLIAGHIIFISCINSFFDDIRELCEAETWLIIERYGFNPSNNSL